MANKHYIHIIAFESSLHYKGLIILRLKCGLVGGWAGVCVGFGFNYYIFQAVVYLDIEEFMVRALTEALCCILYQDTLFSLLSTVSTQESVSA